MTKKNYKSIAKAISWAVFHRCDTEDEVEVVNRVAQEIALELEKDNHAFDRKTFMLACGLPEN